MSYQVDIMDFAHIRADESVLFRGGDKQKRREIGCFAWLLRDGWENILIDTGIMDIDTVNSTRRGTECWERRGMMMEYLSGFGLIADDITRIIITHTHYDHISNISLFKKAMIYMTDQAYAVLMAPVNPFRVQLRGVIDFMSDPVRAKRVVTVDQQLSINENLTIIRVGGHTPGSLIVEARTRWGRCLFTGDAIFLEENIKRRIPIGFSANTDESEEALLLCAAFDGLYLTSHDLRTLSRVERMKTDV